MKGFQLDQNFVKMKVVVQPSRFFPNCEATFLLGVSCILFSNILSYNIPIFWQFLRVKDCRTSCILHKFYSIEFERELQNQNLQSNFQKLYQNFQNILLDCF